ncbi:YadA-like family protein [Neisseria sp. P0007.S010]|uniref:YadA-like family protein n=1 Tax=Neisseria sp. P0007.S010 TaxID=3436697 RepID=UPI003F81E3A2
MKKFNVKALSLAIAAAVVSSAAGAAERDLGSIPEKAQNAMAFQTVFGENTKFDQDTGKFTFDKESSALLLKTMELEQAVNGFAAGSNFVATNEDGSKTVREATQADVEADGFGGLGLKEVVAAHDEALGDLTETVNDNSEALVKTAEVVNAISADVNANKAALEEQKEANEGFNNAIASLDKDIVDLAQAGLKATEALEANRKDIDANTAAIKTKADKADFEELAKYTADMGKKVNDIGDEVTALSDATSAAITRHDKDIVDLAQAGLKATEALEANRKDIDANTAAIETKADKADFEELAKYTADMGKKVNDIGDEVTALSDATSAAITRHDKDIVDLAQAGLKATEALEANRQDIDANKAAIDKKADKADFEELAKYTADMGKKVNDIGDEVTALSDATSAAITRHDKDIVDLAQAGLKATEALEANRQDIDANKAAIAENTASLKEQEKANEGFNNAIASLDEDISTLKKVGLAAADALEVNRQDIDANKAAIDKKADKADFEELAKYTADMGKKVNDIGDEVTALSDATSAAITRHDKDIVDLAQAGLKATEALEANRQDIDANKAAIAENTASLKEQEKANEGFNNAIASLDEDISTLKKVGLAAADALEVNRQDIDANKAAIDKKADKADIETAKNAAVEAEKSAKSAQGSVEVAQKSAETAESHAKAAKTSADAANNVASAAQTAAAQAQDAVKANATQVAANKADIATLQTASNQHAAGIAKNSARIDNLDKNVANLRKETRQGLAAQAALSGLFQPYSVGKFNVTAALGGFKSDTAVAVGAGYRFNENFAAKAGLAVGTSSGGSASYNVGVNYEW